MHLGGYGDPGPKVTKGALKKKRRKGKERESDITKGKEREKKEKGRRSQERE